MKQTTKQITVILGCVIKDGKVLMNQRNEEEVPDAHMKWELPGGKVDFGETPEKSIQRELFEETGVVVKVKKLIPHIEVYTWNYPWGQQHTLILCYVCEFVSQKQVSSDHHVENIAWMPLEKVKSLETLPGAKEFITLANS